MPEYTLRQKNINVYWAWKSMKQRCKNPRCQAYSNYGGRGIRICEEWEDFEPFCEWALNNGYKKGLDLDRIDNDGDYSPENCRWTTRRENINNRRMTIMLTVFGETKPKSIWEEELGLPYGIVQSWVTTRGKKYAESRLEEAMIVGYKERDYSRNHKHISVKCVETGIVYPSIFEAGKQMGINTGGISAAVRRNGIAGGYHFVLTSE